MSLQFARCLTPDLHPQIARIGCIDDDTLQLNASNTHFSPQDWLSFTPCLALVWSLPNTLHKFVPSMSASCLRLCCTSSSEIFAAAQGTRAVWAKPPGAAHGELSPHQRRWHLLCLLETSQLAGLCWWVDCFALTPPVTKGQPAVWLLYRSWLLWKGIFKAQLSSGASPPLCHSVWQLSGFRPDLTQLHHVPASC